MASQMKCPNCDSYEIDYDPARGDAACVDCGTVLEQNVIVNEVAFQEDSRGRSNLVGQTLRADGQSFSVLPGFSRQATEITLHNGRRRLSQLASALKLKSRHVEAALRLFKLGVERNFHRGRRMANVCCACLYVVCRIEKTPHMLLDFADVLETNLYVLGHTFLKFAQLLSLQLPIIDPSLYIHRFASRLEFGEKAHDVAMSALRLMARMQRDWMSEGRRPSGLCGAALLIASRMHDFYRTQAEVAKIVRIGNMVLRQRLQELDKTPTAGMTVKEIEGGGGDDGKETSLIGGGVGCDPPAFVRLQKKKGLLGEGKEVENEEGENDKEAEKTAEKTAEGTAEETAEETAEKAAENTTERDAEVEEVRKAMMSEEMQALEREGRDDGEQQDGTGAEKRAENAREDGTEGEEGEDGENEGEEEEEDDGELSDLDEEDMERYLNTEEEYERKKELWTEVNKDYLEKQQRLEEMKRERPEEYKRLRPWRTPSKKRTKPTKLASHSDSDSEDRPVTPPPKRQSKKLNYSVLETLQTPS